MEYTQEKKTTYTPAVKRAIDKYRQKNAEKFNELQREYYNQSKKDEEWRKRFNERCRINNQKYRQKKKETSGDNPKPRGLPRKNISPLIINDIYNSTFSTQKKN